MAKEEFTESTTSIAAQVGALDGRPCDPGTVRDYADLDLIEHRRLKSGARLFKPSAVAKVRKLRAERIARRGKHPRQVLETPA
jgi:hypothetical protein